MGAFFRLTYNPALLFRVIGIPPKKMPLFSLRFHCFAILPASQRARLIKIAHAPGSPLHAMLPCHLLKYFPERILARDLPLSKLEQVNPPHFDVLP
jgi:hypothetical protein